MHAEKTSTASRSLRQLAFACALLAASPALAELSNDTMIGPGVRSRPAYDGSDAQRGEIVPIVRYLGEPWFLRTTQGVLEGGARLRLAEGLHVGAQLAYEPGRKGSESDFLRNHNVPDIDRGASIGAQLEWDFHVGPAPLTLLARTRTHTESDRGSQADLRLSVGVFQSRDRRLGIGLFTQATWANAKSTRSLYGIAPRQAATTGLPPFDAGSGLLYTSGGLLWSYEITRQWLAVGNVEFRHLQGDARRSPLSERSTNSYVAAGVAYRF